MKVQAVLDIEKRLNKMQYVSEGELKNLKDYYDSLAEYFQKTSNSIIAIFFRRESEKITNIIYQRSL